MQQWQFQEAKAKLSALIKKAIHHGPQEITLRGQSAVVVISKTEYDQLKKPKLSFIELIQQSPLSGTVLELQRNRSVTRDIKL